MAEEEGAPFNGWVDMMGIIEVRTEGGSPADTMDLFHLQRDPSFRNGDIPEDFCRRNYYDSPTGEQNVFHCLVCACELRSAVSLQAHVRGKKHVSRSMEKKRLVLGIPAPSVNMPKFKELRRKRDEKRPDLFARLRERLAETSEPVLGLENVREIFSRDRRRDHHPVYNCTLEGCSSAWGTSDDMFHHVINQKHQKNFLRKSFPNDLRIVSMNNSEVLALATEFEVNRGAAATNRDYRLIVKVTDDGEYFDIRDRPNDWSEKKAKLKLAAAKAGDKDKDPPGSRKRRNSSSADEIKLSPGDMFPKYHVDEGNGNAKAERLVGCMEVMLAEAKTRLDQLEDGSRRKDYVEQSYLARNLSDLKIMSFGLEKRRRHRQVLRYNAFKQSLGQLEARMKFCVDKSVLMMANLRTDVVRLEIEATTIRDSKALAGELSFLEESFRELKFDGPEQTMLAEDLMRSIGNLQKQVQRLKLEERNGFGSGSSSTSFRVSRNQAVDAFTRDVTKMISRQLSPLLREGYFRSSEELTEEIDSLVQKVVREEVRMHEASRRGWESFALIGEIEDSVKHYVTRKVEHMRNYQ